MRIYLINSHGHSTRCVPAALGSGEVLTNPHHKKKSCYKIFTMPRTWADTLVQPKQGKRHEILYLEC